MSEYFGASPSSSHCLKSGEYNNLSATLLAENLCAAAPAQPSKTNDVSDKNERHKVIERQRRMDMKCRYSQLTSLLPATNNRGHTSIADRLSEAKEYISHLQEKVNELAKKRDEMKIKMNNEKQCCYSYNKEGNVVSFTNAFPLVNVNNVGSALLVTTNTIKEGIKLSELVLAVEEQGLQILSAASFATDRIVFHTIQCKVLDTHRFNNGKLKQTLWKLMERNRSSNVSPMICRN